MVVFQCDYDMPPFHYVYGAVLIERLAADWLAIVACFESCKLSGRKIKISLQHTSINALPALLYVPPVIIWQQIKVTTSNSR